MNSKQTDNDQQKKKVPTDWMPISTAGKTKPTTVNIEEKLQEMLGEDVIDEDFKNSNLTKHTESSVSTKYPIKSGHENNAVDSLQTEPVIDTSSTVKRMSSKQRKESLEEYQLIFLSVPKLEDRKPVFISREVRDNLDEIVRKLGRRRMSVSGFIENLARHHFEIYQDDVEMWKKL